jgi:hypothetical protein
MRITNNARQFQLHYLIQKFDGFVSVCIVQNKFLLFSY